MEGLDRAAEEISRITKPDGDVLIDFPDPEKGYYWQQVQKTRQILQGVGIPESILNNTWIVIDSPDQEHFYNRYTPPIKLVEKIFADYDLGLVEEKRGKIFGLTDDENIYLKLRKKSKRQ